MDPKKLMKINLKNLGLLVFSHILILERGVGNLKSYLVFLGGLVFFWSNFMIERKVRKNFRSGSGGRMTSWKELPEMVMIYRYTQWYTWKDHWGPALFFVFMSNKNVKNWTDFVTQIVKCHGFDTSLLPEVNSVLARKCISCRICGPFGNVLIDQWHYMKMSGCLVSSTWRVQSRELRNPIPNHRLDGATTQ